VRPLAHQLLVGQGAKMWLDILNPLIRRRRCTKLCECTVRKDPAKDRASLCHLFGVVR
jgi:hypothetical protein